MKMTEGIVDQHDPYMAAGTRKFEMVTLTRVWIGLLQFASKFDLVAFRSECVRIHGYETENVDNLQK